jgi:membrane protease YdiL (CAAX protease family)
MLLANAWAWSKILARWRVGEPAVRFEPRRAAPWSLLDAGLILGLWFFLSATLPGVFAELAVLRQALVGDLFAIALAQLDAGRDLPGLMFGMLAANAATLAAGALWLVTRGASADDLGLDLKFAWLDLRLGSEAFAAASVPIFLVQAALVYFWESKHPLISMLEEDASGWIVGLIIISAAIAAPVVEEFLFRLTLQGALETAQLQLLSEEPLRTGISVETSGEAPDALETPSGARDQAVDATVERPGLVEARNAPLFAFWRSGPAGPLVRVLPRYMVWGLPWGVWPITITATLFALLHAGHGPDPIPLLLLALVLGYLYRQTHRLAPCIVMHALLNSWSLTMFWLGRAGRIGID